MNVTGLYDAALDHIITWSVWVVSSLYQVYIGTDKLSICANTSKVNQTLQPLWFALSCSTNWVVIQQHHALFIPLSMKNQISSFFNIQQHWLAIWCWQGIFLQNMSQFAIRTCKNTSTAISKIYTVLCCRLSCVWWWPHDKMVAGCIFYDIALYRGQQRNFCLESN